MIFFGKDRKNSKSRFRIGFRKSMGLVDTKTYIPNYYLILCLGKRRYWIGYNHLKRIIRDRLYALDGKKIRYDKEAKVINNKSANNYHFSRKSPLDN